MKKLFGFIAALSIGLAGFSAGWTGGLGASFISGIPLMDGYIQYQIVPEVVAVRFNAIILQISAPASNAILSLSMLFTPSAGPVTFYFGAGAGANLTFGGGGASGLLATEIYTGLGTALWYTSGVYMQVKFLGTIGGGAMTGALLPGIGLWTKF